MLFLVFLKNLNMLNVGLLIIGQVSFVSYKTVCCVNYEKFCCFMSVINAQMVSLSVSAIYIDLTKT